MTSTVSLGHYDVLFGHVNVYFGRDFATLVRAPYPDKRRLLRSRGRPVEAHPCRNEFTAIVKCFTENDIPESSYSNHPHLDKLRGLL